MQTNTIDKVKQFKGKKILVVGDIMIDNYVSGTVNRICPEAPVPIMDVEHSYSSLGGAGNVAVYLSQLGAEVYLYGQVGQDHAKRILKTHYDWDNIEFIGETLEGYRTTTKNRAVSNDNQIVFRWDDEEIRQLEDFDKDKLEQTLKEVDAVIISDYAKGVVTHEISEFIIQRHDKVIVDPKFGPWSHFTGAYIVKPNKKEYEDLGLNSDVLHYESEELNTNLIVTIGRDGMKLGRKDGLDTEHVPTEEIDVVDVTGAGDMVSAVLCLSATVDMDLLESMRLANIAAGIKVSQHGTGHISQEELLNELIDQNVEDRIFNLITDQFEFIKLTRDKQVVFTNGCFDLMHDGHIQLLKKAKAEGDILVVGLNSDASIKRLKGENRPIQNEKVRAEVMASIKYVDAVVLFDEDTPLELIKTIQPDVLVKGNDYAVSEIVGANEVLEGGGKVVTVDLVEGSSTTGIVEKIKGA